MNCLTKRERNDKRRVISYKKRKLIERAFGWNKSDRPLRQIKLRGLTRVDWFYRFTMAAYNLTRMCSLVPLQTAAR
jgi:Transposase DDE domain